MVTVADTAFSIAEVRAAEAELPPKDRLFDDPYARHFLAAGEHAREATERYLSLPFFRDGIRLRTRFIDDEVRAALRAGARQLVLLGAGFDARGMRLAEATTAGVVTFEVDTSEQLARKRACLEAARLAPATSVHHVPFDFAASKLDGPLVAVLEKAGWSSTQRSVFVWEGVIGYIDSEAIDDSLRFMAGASRVGARVIFTFGEANLDPVPAAERVRRAGFASFEEVGLDDVWRSLLAGEPHAAASQARMGVANAAPRD
jgi:methyltransferase (TIGR00027 family)